MPTGALDGIRSPLKVSVTLAGMSSCRAADSHSAISSLVIFSVALKTLPRSVLAGLRERPEQDAAAGVATTLWQLTAVNVFDPAATALAWDI